MKVISTCWAKTITLYISVSIILGLLISAFTWADTTQIQARQIELLKNIGAEQVFESNIKQTHLLELYSSQGCSSCPPAQNWVNNLSQHEGLWTEFIPVVFHVDYWDYLGWKDPFSSSRYSQRQRSFEASGASNAVYTPGFILNGREWRDWFTRRHTAHNALTLNLYSDDSPDLGILRATLNRKQLDIDFDTQAEVIDYPIHVNIAVLGLDITTNVTRGENARRQLHESFIVLAYERELMQKDKSYDLPNASYKHDNLALVVWLTHENSLEPIQAVGGPLTHF